MIRKTLTIFSLFGLLFSVGLWGVLATTQEVKRYVINDW